MSDEFPKPSGDAITDRKRQRAAEAQRQAHSSAPLGSADERLQSLRREGWRDTWMAAVLVNSDDTEVAVVFPNGTYFRGTREYPPNAPGERPADKSTM